MIKVLLVDDETPARERLKKLLKAHSDIEVVGEAADGLSGLSAIASQKPDLVFLDVDMPELTGLELARTLGAQGPPIIFVTAFDEHALEAFESSAIDYLVKPVAESRLKFSLEKARKSLIKINPPLPDSPTKMGQSRLAVKIGSRYEVFDPALISVGLAQNHYTSLRIGDRELLTDDSLDTILSRLDPSLFLRVHRSTFLNIKFLKELKREGDRKYLAILNDKTQSRVAISRERLSELKKILGLE